MDAADQTYGYIPSGETASPRDAVSHGAGANPSTAAGLIVIGAVLVLIAMRRGFRSYM